MSLLYDSYHVTGVKRCIASFVIEAFFFVFTIVTHSHPALSNVHEV